MKNYVKNSIDDMFKRYEYPQSFKDLMYKINDLVSDCEIERILSTYQSVDKLDIDKLSEISHELSEKYNVHSFTFNLYELVCLVPKLKEFFKEKGIDESVFYNTVNDIRYKYRECTNVRGVEGIRDSSWKRWYNVIFEMRIFGLGRFQYEIKQFRLKEYSKDGNVVREGDEVLNIHIPSSGVSLTKEERYKSYAMAKEFFKDKFGGKPIPVVCWSWLMNPEHDKILPNGSNIVDFMHDFDIIDTEEYPDYNVLSPWIFGKERVDLDTMPENSSLQRSIKKHLQNGGKLAWGYGVFFL
jgi:hypothetical protein